MNFETALTRVLRHEAGYVDHPADPGGATNYGITERVARAAGYIGSMRDFPLSLAGEIYRRNYWDAVHGDKLPGGVAFQVFDAAVNHGAKQAAMLLQRAVGVTANGIIGPRTLAAAAAFPPAGLLNAFNAERLAFYTALPTWPSFGKGWVNRVALNLRYAAEDM